MGMYCRNDRTKRSTDVDTSLLAGNLRSEGGIVTRRGSCGPVSLHSKRKREVKDL